VTCVVEEAAVEDVPGEAPLGEVSVVAEKDVMLSPCAVSRNVPAVVEAGIVKGSRRAEGEAPWMRSKPVAMLRLTEPTASTKPPIKLSRASSSWPLVVDLEFDFAIDSVTFQSFGFSTRQTVSERLDFFSNRHWGLP